MVKNCQRIGSTKSELAWVEPKVPFLFEIFLNFAYVQLVTVKNNGNVFISPYVSFQPEEQKIEECALMMSDIEGCKKLVLSLKPGRGTGTHKDYGN